MTHRQAVALAFLRVIDQTVGFFVEAADAPTQWDRTRAEAAYLRLVDQAEGKR